MDYTAVGQTTHLAARMEQLAAPGSIVVAPETLRLARGYVAVKPLGPVKVKGMSEPVDVYEVMSAGAVRTRLEQSAARGFSRFVGRDAEMELLRGAFERAGRGHGQVVAVVGEPGVGKSRLFFEFIHSHRFSRGASASGDWLVVETGSVSYGKATPYLPVIDLLKAYVQIDARDDVQKIREKVTGKLLTLDETLRPLLPALLALLDIPVDDRDWEALDPRGRRRYTHEAIKRLLLRESQRQPLCLVIEDLHWIDAETQAVIDGLVESLPAARLLVLTNYRPEYSHNWGSKTYYSQARIDPLLEASATELLGALLGDDASIRPLKPLLIERTEGNPFFLEESVRALVETGVLAGDAGRHRLAQPIGSIQVPATVQAILAARIDRLPSEAKSLLQSASVVGKDVPFAHLCAIAEQPEEALRAQLAHLQAAEFLYETSLFPDLEYTFKHALTHEVVYGSMLNERRRALHGRIVEAIETLHPDRLGEHVERLAHHALRGEEWPKAVAYLRQAAAKAVARSANQDEVQANIQLGRAYRNLGESPRAIAAFKRNVDALVGDLQTERFGMNSPPAVASRVWIGLCLIDLGEFPAAMAMAEEAMRIAEAADDRYGLAYSQSRVGLTYLRQGDPERAIPWLERSLDGSRRFNFDLLSLIAAGPLGEARATCGETVEAFALLEQAAEQAASIRFVTILPDILRALGEAYLLAGRLPEARHTAERMLELTRAAGQRHGETNALRILGEIHAGTNPAEASQAEASYREALAIAEQIGTRPLAAHCHLGLGKLYRRGGKQQEAQEHLTTAATMYHEMGMQFWLKRVEAEQKTFER
jgi:tetratricopeptide (TPR) repeat protein